ncbi:hypothetical protein TRFO_22474 [Tritrichomonas foetus]|uniref:Bromodomain associated domain-containing protein n=1 Tax=Tritrichomonas foetus TaxID=1144522 RepID=A0A1J4KHT0_9EUKA|nr:hypothetical protein TRFO_22474 [Tritrichomonas foetus]|eukprot:OHT08885.1 hypothetical protein TRFO_22474 [Tritrichomonas foetus]
MSDEFTRHFFKHFIAKLAANMSDGNGFTSLSEMALDIFADAAIYRLQKYAREIRQMIEYSGRTEPNGFDVFNVLWRYKETMNTLSVFLIDQGQTLEFQVKEYPVPQASRFHSRYMQGSDILPFRANTAIGYDPTQNEPPLPHIPRFFPSPFGEEGILIDDDLDSGANSNLIRRQNDVDALVSVMKEQTPEVPIPPEIHIDCPFVDQLINAVIGDNPQPLPE